MQLLFVLCVATSNVDADELKVAAIPEWVADRQLNRRETDMQTSSDEAFDVLLDEQQLRFEPGNSAQFVREVLRANSARAVGLVSTIEIPYIPAYQSINLHYVRIHRDGEVIDKSDSIRVRYLRQGSSEPDELDEFMTVASVLVGGVMVGDVVDYAVSVTGQNPNFDGVYTGRFAYGGMSAQDVYRRVLVPRNTELSIKLHRGHPEPEVRGNSQYDIYVWDVGAVEQTEVEANVPVWYVPLPMAEFSNQLAWSDVSSWALDRFRLPDERSDAVAELASELAAGPDNPRKKLSAALRFVQSNVRYVGPGIGRNGYRPYPPATVLDRLYGDCKDKVALLQALLDSMGIESWPALVNSNGGKLLDGHPPAPTLFDHVVLHARIGESDFWVDPTLPPLPNDDWALLPVHDYGQALVVREGEYTLTSIPRSQMRIELDRARYETVIALDEDQTHSRTALMRWRLRGFSAETVSQTRDFMGDREFARFVRNIDLQDRKNIEVVEPAVVEQNSEAGEVVIQTRYDVSSLVEEYPDRSGAYAFVFPLSKLEHFVDLPPKRQRSAPYALPYPFAIEERIVTELGAQYFQPLATEATVETDHFRFSAVPAWDGESFSITYSYETLADHVAPERYESFRSELEWVLDRQWFSIDVRADAWPVPGTREDDVVAGMSLESFVDTFERENEELGVGVGEPLLTAGEITDVIRGWDRNKVPVSKEILSVYQAVARHQRVPDSMELLTQEKTATFRDGFVDVYWIGLCLRLGDKPGYCLPIRKD